MKTGLESLVKNAFALPSGAAVKNVARSAGAGALLFGLPATVLGGIGGFINPDAGSTRDDEPRSRLEGAGYHALRSGLSAATIGGLLGGVGGHAARRRDPAAFDAAVDGVYQMPQGPAAPRPTDANLSRWQRDVARNDSVGEAAARNLANIRAGNVQARRAREAARPAAPPTLNSSMSDDGLERFRQLEIDKSAALAKFATAARFFKNAGVPPLSVLSYALKGVAAGGAGGALLGAIPGAVVGGLSADDGDVWGGIGRGARRGAIAGGTLGGLAGGGLLAHATNETNKSVAGRGWFSQAERASRQNARNHGPQLG